VPLTAHGEPDFIASTKRFVNIASANQWWNISIGTTTIRIVASTITVGSTREMVGYGAIRPISRKDILVRTSRG